MASNLDTTIVRAHVVDGDRVLLGLRRSSGEWSTFGGWIEGGESVEDALRRELHEELGIDARTFRRLADRDQTSDGRPASIAVFVVTAWRGTVRNVAIHEHSEVRWFSSDELHGLPMHEQARSEALALLQARHVGGME